MANQRFAIIVNPKASGGKAIKKLPEISTVASHIAPEYMLHVTGSIEDARVRANEFAALGVERIVAVGGDGTFNEVANGILESGRRVELGIVPAGTGCDLPRTLAVPTSIKDALEFALTGAARPMDVGLARTSTTERHFLNVAGLGFDAKVADRAQRKKHLSGKKAYIAALAQSLTDFGHIDVSIEVDGTTIETKAVFVSIANAQYLAGGFHFAPMAVIDDGLLDLAIISDISLPGFLKAVPSVVRGKHLNNPHWSHYPTTHVRVTSATPALVQLDGEIAGTSPAEFSVVPRAIDIVAPTS
ncbi:MAG: diacylglycerol kinase family lipid kinase [Thermomicrobiales bacterium]|nr:diacylglycerol kinase family lipid kinase [Thermomicrobiales bacterium]MCO5222659.1 diacylglycerol kinase family lipid kinase [Thermomicrobiales bacterium]